MKTTINNLKIPTHIAYIIDGNGRWAKERNKPRSYGHKYGFKALKEIIRASFELGIKYVGIYAFSTENWNRPKAEVDYLIKILRDYIKTKGFLKDFKDTKLNIMGDYTKFPKDLAEACERTMEETKNNEFVLNLGINYGGRDEILHAINEIKKNEKCEITAEIFEKYLYTANQPSPDFIIRTSGEQRLSNFMLWQCAYAEFYFPKTYWPDFDRNELIKALEEYSKRDRRFGAIKEG